MNLLQRALFSQKYTVYATVHAVMLNKKDQKSSNVQEEELTNEGRHTVVIAHASA